MPLYLVTWSIDIEADGAVEAARKASAAQHRAGTLASVYEVRAPDGTEQRVDLAEVNQRVLDFIAKVDAEQTRALAAGQRLTTREAIGRACAQQTLQ